MIRVVIADDQALMRGGFRMILEAEDDIEVVEEAIDGADAVRAFARVHPDVVVMDVRMPTMDGIEATRRITAEDLTAKILILTTFDLDEYVYDALRAGASGFLLKDRPPEELVAAVRIVATGDALLSPSVTRRLIAEFASRPARPPGNDGLQDLTDRERDGRGRLERRDRAAAVRGRDDGEDPRRARPAQARPARSRPGRRVRVRVRSRPAGRLSPHLILADEAQNGSAGGRHRACSSLAS